MSNDGDTKVSKFGQILNESNQFVVKCLQNGKLYGYLGPQKQGSYNYVKEVKQAEMFVSLSDAEEAGEDFMDSCTKAGVDYHVLDAKTGKRYA